MSVSIPVTGLFAAKFTCTCVCYIKRLKQFIKIFSIGKLKNKFLQSLCIFKGIIYSFIKTFDVEIVFQIIKICHKEIKQIFTVHPISEQQSEFISLFLR